MSDNRRRSNARGKGNTGAGRSGARLTSRAALWAVIGAAAVALAVHAQQPTHTAVAASASGPTPTTATTAAPQLAPTTTIATASAAPSKAFCDLVRGYAEQVRRITISLTDPTVLKPLLEAVLPALDQPAPLTSAAAAPDVAAVRAALGDLKAGLDADGYDYSKLPPDLIVRLTSPGFLASFGRLQSLAAGGC